MTEQFKEQLDDQKIKALYRRMSTELPSAEIDKAILLEAKRQRPKSHGQNWRKYQWPASIAASVVFITFLVFTQFTQFDPSLSKPKTDAVDPFAISDNATLQERGQQHLETKTRQENLSTQETQAAALPEEDLVLGNTIAEPALSNYAEEEARGLAARALDGIELDIDPSVFEPDPINEIDIVVTQEESISGEGFDEESSAELARTKIESEILESTRSKSVETDIEAISLTVSRIYQEATENPPVSSVNMDYLNDLLLKINVLNEQSSLTNEQQETLSVLQKDMVDYLSLMRLAEPGFKIEEKYLEVLTQSQKSALAK